MEKNWNKTVISKPCENVVVHTKIEDESGTRNKQDLIYYKGMWWCEDMSTYVYYTPTHWSY